jgi:alpha-mannosidase
MTALKLSEDKKHLIFRGYESSGKSHHVQLKVPEWAMEVSKANLLEKMDEILPIIDGKVLFNCAPHEIVTIMLDHY